MPNEENTQQLPNANGPSRSLEARVTTLEEIVLARLNDMRLFEKQLLAMLSEINEKFDRLSSEVAELRTDFN